MMVHKVIKCGLIGGFIVFLWGMISWTVLPWQKSQIMSFANETEVRNAIGDNMYGSGLYTLPNLHKYAHRPEELSSAKYRMSVGPYATVAVMADGRNPNMAGNAVAALAVDIIAACLVTWLLLKGSQALDFTKSVKFITVVGAVIAIAGAMPYVIWFGFPGSFAIGSMLETVVGWFFASLAISRMLAGQRKA